MERVGVTADVMTHLNVVARTEFIPKDVCNEIEFVHSLSFSPCNCVHSFAGGAVNSVASAYSVS